MNTPNTPTPIRFKPILPMIACVVATALLAALLAATPATAQPIDAPEVFVDPASGPAGTTTTVFGRGFDAQCVEVTIVGSGKPVAYGYPPVESDGTFSTELTVPGDAEPGMYAVTATGQNFAGEFCTAKTDQTARTTFTVETNSVLVPRFVPIKPTYEAPLGPGFKSNQLHLKFHQSSRVRLVDGEFVSLGDDNLAGLAEVLGSHPGVEAARLFDSRSESEHDRDKARIEARTGHEQGDKNLYFLVQYPDSVDAVALLNDLNELAIVEIAYPASVPTPDPALADYQDLQGYRVSATSGIHADAANTVAGGTGANVQVIDIERYFNDTHEDLPAVTVYPNGDIAAATSPPYDHGTAVLGVIFGTDNDNGILGLAHDAAAGFVSTAGGRANAIDVAAANSDPGDVILLELQTTGPAGTCSNATTPPQIGCVPQEYQQASYDAIVAAVGAGIIVVAAAGNGYEDLDHEDFDTTLGGRPDSGAIIVGAGAAGSDDGCTNPERGRLTFSNFGSRVNLQGWGECVATLGYGGLEGGADTDDAYTAGFCCTSSASPIVASAAAILSSVAIENGDLDGLTSTEARSLLVSTGTPQDTSGAALSGNIGPLPNLAAALGLEADLVVTKTADPNPAVAGESITYTVSVTNAGPNVATDVVVVDNLPNEPDLTTFDPACAVDFGDLVCDLDTLEVGETVDLEVVMDIPADLVFNAGSPVTITNTAAATSTIDDPDESNNTAVVDTLVRAVVDLGIETTEIPGPPPQALIGEPFDVTVQTEVYNLGPSAPVDAELETVPTPSAGATADPVVEVSFVGALDTGSPQIVEQTFTVTCTGPGFQSVTFDQEIAPANPDDIDPDDANNTGQATLELECIVPIAINVRPGNQFNKVNLKGNGVINVAALTTEAGEYGLPVAFDATSIVHDSVRFGNPAEVWAQTGGAGSHNGVAHIADSFELDDHTKDGDDDHRIGFVTSDTDLVSSDTEACMRGQYVDGATTFSFFGCDVVDIKG